MRKSQMKKEKKRIMEKNMLDIDKEGTEITEQRTIELRVQERKKLAGNGDPEQTDEIRDDKG